MSSASDLSKRVAGIAPSATLALSNRARELRAEGKPVISFGAGEPDFPTPDYIVEAAAEACGDVRWHKYSPAAGLPELREAVAEKTKRDSGYEVGANQVIITNGGKHAIYNSMAALLNPGDEVIVIAPYWTTYPEAISVCTGKPVIVDTDIGSCYQPSVEQLEKAFSKKTKAMVFVSPSNPTGIVYPKELIAEIGDWAAEKGIWVITDEIYEHLTYDDHEHHSMPVLCEAVREKCVVVNGVAKTYAMTGWRVGWLIAPPDLAKAVGTLQSHQTSNISNIAQMAALSAVSGPLTAVEEMKQAFDRRRRTMHEMLEAIPGVSCLLPQGAFYAFPSFAERLKDPVDGRKVGSSSELADMILEEVNVALVSGEAFGAPGYCRLSFALGDDDLAEGLGRMAEFLAR